MKHSRAGILAAVLAAAPGVAADSDAAYGFLRIRPTAIEWHAEPDGHGVQSATLLGDPAKPGLYVVRVRFPPHVMDMPHWHPNARYVTVLEGTWYAGTGTHFDVSRAEPMPPGSVMLHPARAPHWDGSATDEAVIVQIIGEGPGTSTAVDPHAPGWVEVTR